MNIYFPDCRDLSNPTQGSDRENSYVVDSNTIGEIVYEEKLASAIFLIFNRGLLSLVLWLLVLNEILCKFDSVGRSVAVYHGVFYLDIIQDAHESLEMGKKMRARCQPDKY